MGNDYFSGGANAKTSTHHEQESILNASAPVSKARERNGNIVSWTVQHHAELLSAILMVFAIFIVFVSEFDITNASWARAISAETLILATCSYIVYLNSYTIGTNTATRIEFTKKVEDAYLAEVKKIRDKRIEWMLELFCSDYKTGELKKTRTEILLCAGFSEADTALMLEGKDIDESALTEEQAKALKKAKVLSGGEKVRCMLAKMMLEGSNFLIFDEPTNHLDLESITALNNGLSNYRGCMLLTSHDQELMNTVANRIIEINDKKVYDRQVTYDEYIEETHS